MTQKILLVLLACVCYLTTSAQKASDVLERGIYVKPGEKIFLKFSNGELKYYIGLSLRDAAHPPDYTPLDDSLILLASKNAINVYMTPLNPLSFSFTTETKEIADPINEAAAAGLASIIEVLSSVRPGPGPHSAVPTKCDTLFGFLEASVKDIQTRLNDNQQSQVADAFNALKSLSFRNQKNTEDSIAIIKKWIKDIKDHFSDLETKINATKEAVKTYDCETEAQPDRAFTIRYIFTNILKEAADLENEQKKRLENLQMAYDLVEKAKNNAAVNDTGLEWCIELPAIPAKKEKVYIYTITVKESGYRLSDKKEIVNVESKELLKRTVSVRKFQLFVPEVSVGTAFTFFKYNTYGTTTDSAGIKTNNQHVASPVENTVKNINISTMLNWNLFCPNSPLHPLIQTGVGINAGIPTLLIGGGLRFGVDAKNRLRITGGIAFSWIKELDKLQVGDVVSGTDDIEKDMKYQFTWWGEKNAPKPYLSIQYNF